MKDRIIKIDERLISGLAKEYAKSQGTACVIANICDEVLDKSGQLLGEVRDEARHIIYSDN